MNNNNNTVQTPLKKSKINLIEENKNDLNINDLMSKQVQFMEQPKPGQDISEADIS